MLNPMEPLKDHIDRREPIKNIPTISLTLKDGALVEMVHRLAEVRHWHS